MSLKDISQNLIYIFFIKCEFRKFVTYFKIIFKQYPLLDKVVSFNVRLRGLLREVVDLYFIYNETLPKSSSAPNQLR